MSADITISKGGAGPVSARSILAVLSLDVRNATRSPWRPPATPLDSLAVLLTTDLAA